MKYLSLILLTILLVSCKKDWLDIKPNQSLVVPTKIEDFQSLLDNSTLLNQSQTGDLGEVGAGDFQVTYPQYQTFAARYRNAYIWSATEDFYQGSDPEWSSAYQRILLANIALEGISKLTAVTNAESSNNVKGSALFYRAYNFYNLAQQYCNAYSEIADQDLGIPLHLKSDINQKSTRGSVKNTYDQIVADLNEAALLLPVTPLFKTRPSKPAAYGMLARVYLSMRDYSKAMLNADKSLSMSATILDYSDLDPSQSNPFSRFNPEVLFHCTLGNTPAFSESNLDVVPELLNLYGQNDLRKQLFFASGAANVFFKGSYDGSQLLFSGLATDEILLIRAECSARLGKLTEALIDLNMLLKKRFAKTPIYEDFVSSDQPTVIKKILQERRKELCFRGLRWSDLRRLNPETAYQVTLTRILNGQSYQLLPNDLKYTLPIYAKEINASGIEQNPRN